MNISIPFKEIKSITVLAFLLFYIYMFGESISRAAIKWESVFRAAIKRGFPVGWQLVAWVTDS